MIVCPNFSNPDVAREFEELKAATSEKAAYAIWSLNNGNAIDKAPNGALSKLFLDLLLYFNGDRTLAIRAKSKVYSSSFIQWFGDWIGANAVYDDEGNRVDEVSKVVDENGEPLVVYHYSDNETLTEFSTDFDNYFSQSGGTKKAIFFTEDNPNEEERGGNFITKRRNKVAAFLNIKDLKIYKGTKEDLHNQGTSYREVVNKSAEENDVNGGVHMEDFDDNKKEHQSIWIIHNPNQVKSATDNNGLFSKTNNNIYVQESGVSHLRMIYIKQYDTELKELETEGFNPFSYFKSRKYSVLSEKTSELFDKYRLKAQRAGKKNKYGYPKQFLDSVTNILYVKSNGRQDSRRYDAINPETGEVYAAGILLFTKDEFESKKESSKKGDPIVPKTFNPNRSINFALLRQLPSKERYKAVAKQYLYDAILSDDDVVNFKIIDDFVDSMPDALWDYISSDVYGFNEDVYMGPFYYGTTDTSDIAGATSMMRSTNLSINLPKLGMIKYVEELTGVSLLGRKVKFANRLKNKMPNKNRLFGEEVVLDNNLTRPELEYLIHQILHKEYFKPSSSEENLRHFAEDHGTTYEAVLETIRRNREEWGDMYASEQNSRMYNYDWQWIRLTRQIEKKWHTLVEEYIRSHYSNKFTKNQIDYITQYFSGILPWINISFNKDSNSGDSEVYNRLAAVIHEPFHALHALVYNTPEEKLLRDAYNKLISTSGGKHIYNLAKDTLTLNLTDEGIYKEICAYVFLLINIPPEFRQLTGETMLSTKIYNYIKDIIEAPKLYLVETTSTQEGVSATEEVNVKLNFMQKLYNVVVSALHKIIPMMKRYILLIDTYRYDNIEISLTNTQDVLTETELSKQFAKLQQAFIDAFEEFAAAISALLSVDNNVMSSVNIKDFFVKDSQNFAQESFNIYSSKDRHPYVKPETTRADISVLEDVMAQKPVYYSTLESKIVFLKNIVKKYLKHRDFKLKGFKPLYCIFSPKNVVRDHYSEETLKQQFKEAVEACGGAVEDFNMKQSQYNPQELLITSKKTNFAAQKRQYQKPQTSQGEFESGLSLMASPEEIALSQSITHLIYDLGVQIDNERHLYVNSVLNQYKVNNPNASQTELARVLNSARHLFNVDRSKRIMRENQTVLAQMFGLTMNRSGYFESSETTLKKLMYEFFINSLQESTFKAYNLDNLNRTKYQQVGVVENATSLANLLYNSIYDGDLVTLDKALARDYVRMFWGSDLIQSALKSLDDGSKTASQLEEDLVSRMTRNPANTRNTNIISWFLTIWQNLSQLVKQVFSGVVFTDQQKSEILRAVDAAFMLAEDLYYTNNNSVIYDRIDGKYDTSELLSEKDKQILSDIKQGTKTRLKSQLSRNVKNQKLIADLKSRLEIMEGKNEDSIDDVYDIIQDFLVTANSEINKTRNYIDRILLIPGNMENWNPQEINFIQQDLIGFYKNLLFTIYDLFNDETSAINKFNKIRVLSDPNAIDLKNFSKELLKTVEGLQTDYNSYVVKPYVRMVLTNYVEEDNAVTDKQTFIYNMERWLEQDFAYGDLAAGEVIIGMASRSKSPIVRIVEQMASAAEYAAHRQVLSKGHELVRLYNKVRPIGSQISPYNWQKRFMEFDKDGISTGYFVREVNAGQFYLDKDAEEERLRLKYGLERDEDGNIIFNDQDLRANDSVYNKFNDELDEWLDKHCHRRYTLDYYKARRRFLSPNTLIAQGRIQRQIDLVLDKCRMPSGFVDLSKLTISERRQLDILRKLKRDLGSHYIFTEDPDTGILHVENKVGEALQMADEITAWNKHIAERVKYKPNWDAFNEAKLQLIDSGASQQEVDDFIRNNTTTRITSEFYDTLRTAVGKSATTPELENLKRRHSEILNAIKERQGAGSHNLNKLGVGLNTDRSGWIELQRLEQRMAEIKHDLAARGIKGIPGDGSLTFDQLATTLYVTTGDQSNESYLMYLINQWRSAAASGTNLQNVFNQLFTFKDEKGRIRYLNAFKYLTPLDFTLDINGRIIHCIESLPGTEYSELDESSDYVNEFFLKDGPSMQPKAYDDNGSRLYKSEAYEKLSSGEIQFLNALKATMEEANDMIPNKAVSRDELLPQISGRTMTVLANSIMGKEWSTALSYPFRKFGVKYAETEDDVSTNTDLARRPDGTVVNNIPIRFINRLGNRATQSTDVLGSVIMYYDMACNYASKSKNLPTLELIKFAIDPARNTNQHLKPEQYKKVENILDQRYYGKETSFGFSSNEKITPAKQRVIQSTKAIRNFASVAMLGINFTTIEVGYIDAMCSMLADGIAGKYITLEDMRVALIDCIKHTPKVLAGLGNPVVNDKLVAAMQYNNLSRSNSDIFSSTDQFKVDRFVREHLLMGGYTLTDYMVNGLMLRATYNTYRLIADPKTNKWSFYSKSDAINEFTKLGYTEKQAVKLWNKSAVTLWDAYDCVDGDFVVKDLYKDIITKKLEDRISGRLRDRTAMYNGVIPITERAKIQQNVFGSFLTLMRNFYVNTYWDRFKTGGDYVTEDGDHNINWRSEYQRDDLGMVNFETGEFEGAVFKDFARGMYKLTTNAKSVIIGSQHNKLTREQKYAVTRGVSELVMIGGLLFLMLWSVAFARSNNYDDDKEPVWTLNLIGDGPLLDIKPNHVEEKFMDFLRWKLALLATRGFTERLTSWWAPTVLELFTSPSTATSYLDDIGVMWGFIIDLFSQRADEKIKTGGYKHMTRGTRDLLKLFSPLGVDNLVRSWHTDGIKSTFNFYRKLAPTNAIVPSQQEWNEQHGLGKHGATGEKKKSRKKKFKEFE